MNTDFSSQDDGVVYNASNELVDLFREAKERSEFDFVLTLLNHRGVGVKDLATNLHEWFDAIEFYKELYFSFSEKRKTRVAALLYCTFFENSDFYNIIGSLCKNKMGYKGSSYLFWKTKKYERLLGIGEKQDFLLELLGDAGKENIIEFFKENHFKEIRNTFFHSAYSLSDDEYHLHDSGVITIGEIGYYQFNINDFFYPKVGNIITFFDVFKKAYLDNFASYKEDKQVYAKFPDIRIATILGSKNGLKGFRVKNVVSFFGKLYDAGIWFDEELDMWRAMNISINFDNIEDIEIKEQLSRYEGKGDIVKNDAEFQNLVDKIVDRRQSDEIAWATRLLVKFGDVRLKKMIAQENPYKQRSFPKIILPFYKQAIDIGSHIMDMSKTKENISVLEEFMADK